MPTADKGRFWNDKILGWEDSRYGVPDISNGLVERIAGGVSSSLRFRLTAAVRLLAPHVRGRRVVEVGCGSGYLAAPLIEAGAIAYQGFDIAPNAIDRARRLLGGLGGDARPVRFDVAAVTDLHDQGDAMLVSLGLFDWLTDDEISHLFAIGRSGPYLHALSERRLSAQQLIHRLYVHVAYGRRTGLRPRYQSVAEIDALLAATGRPPAGVFRHPRLRFGIFVSDLPLPPL